MIPTPPPPPPPPHVMENGRYPSPPVDKMSPYLLNCLNIINIVTQLLIGAVACFAFFITNHLAILTDATKQHIYLCVTGYIILMSQAVLTISPASWTSALKHDSKKTIHWVMQILGSILAVTGTIIKIVNIENHFDTIHGSFGILALIFTCLSLAGGIINLFSLKGDSRINPKFIKIGHSCFGCLTLILAFLALTFAFDKEFLRYFYYDTNMNMLMSFTIIALIGTLTSPCVNITRRIMFN